MEMPFGDKSMSTYYPFFDFKIFGNQKLERHNKSTFSHSDVRNVIRTFNELNIEKIFHVCLQ